jgi:hypothetical protein
MSDELPGSYATKLRDGQKLVPITLVIYMTASVPKDWDEDQIQFWVEEHHCHSNYINELHDSQTDDGGDHICSHSDAYVGHRKVK